MFLFLFVYALSDLSYTIFVFTLCQTPIGTCFIHPFPILIYLVRLLNNKAHPGNKTRRISGAVYPIYRVWGDRANVHIVPLNNDFFMA